MNPSEDIEQENTYVGVGRFYECVFCKRGFGTAQALGGHMNIHRKDRSRNKPASQRKQEEEYTGPRSYQQIPASRNDHDRYSRCSSTGTSAVPLYGNPQQQRYGMNDFDRERRKRTNQSISPDDWPVRLDFPPVIMECLEKNPEEELDLELRLGYDS